MKNTYHNCDDLVICGGNHFTCMWKTLA